MHACNLHIAGIGKEENSRSDNDVRAIYTSTHTHTYYICVLHTHIYYMCVQAYVLHLCACIYSELTNGSERQSVEHLIHALPHVSIRQHTSAYVSIPQHTSAYVSVRQHTSVYVQHTSAYVSIRQHTSAYVSRAWNT